LHAFAKTLGENKAANLLAMTLERKKTDATLTRCNVNNQQSSSPKRMRLQTLKHNFDTKTS
jgi:ferritin-like metal-binding protein YciE